MLSGGTKAHLANKLRSGRRPTHRTKILLERSDRAFRVFCPLSASSAPRLASEPGNLQARRLATV